VKSVLKKDQLCFKALPTQGPLDLICLRSEVRIRENELGLIRGFRLDSLEVDRLTLFLSSKFRFSLPWPPKLLARARGYVSFVTV
jgi:hypothetical protein